jgi:NADH dehydrogenase/NADH:ubiquinone oxidoreductase subunit G
MTEKTKINLKIDGKKCQVSEGTTILEAARSMDINIPVICLHDATTAEGLCRQ